MSLLNSYANSFLENPTKEHYEYIKSSLKLFKSNIEDKDNLRSIIYLEYLFDDYNKNKELNSSLKMLIKKELRILLQTPQDQFVELFKKLGSLSEQNNWGDPFSYARSREIMASIKLGHDICGTYSGADAFTKCELKKPIEYKSTIGPKICGSYTGISVFPTWQEQYLYLETKKIGKYLHFYNRFSNHELVESWTVPTNKVLEILSKKLRKSFDEQGNIKASQMKKKDPRLSASMTYNEIVSNGVQVI